MELSVYVKYAKAQGREMRQTNLDDLLLAVLFVFFVMFIICTILVIGDWVMK